MSTETPQTPQTPAKSARDRYVKLGFLVVALLIVGGLIILPHLTKPLRGWDDDLDAALEQAAAEDRKIVAVLYDTPQNQNYDRLRGILQKGGNIEALEAADVIRVHARVDKDDALVRRFKVTTFPTTLLIGPDGKVITRWTGYIGEVAFRQNFLQGEPQRQ